MSLSWVLGELHGCRIGKGVRDVEGDYRSIDVLVNDVVRAQVGVGIRRIPNRELDLSA